MSKPSWRGQIQRALNAIDRIGESKYRAKKAQGWRPGEAVAGLFSFDYKNTVFDRAITFTNWLGEHYPDLRLFQEVAQDTVRRCGLSCPVAHGLMRHCIYGLTTFSWRTIRSS